MKKWPHNAQALDCESRTSQSPFQTWSEIPTGDAGGAEDNQSVW